MSEGKNYDLTSLLSLNHWLHCLASMVKQGLHTTDVVIDEWINDINTAIV